MSPQTRDAVLTLALLVVFPALVSVHVVTLFGLAKHRQFAAALGGIVFPPVAPYCAFVRGMPGRAIAWLVLAGLYALVYLLAR